MELQLCRQSVFPSLKECLVKSLYEKIGGVPRYVLEFPQSLVKAGEGSVEVKVFEHLQSAIDKVRNVANLVELIYEGKGFAKYSNRLFHRWPRQGDLSSFTIKWASTYIEQQLLEQLESEARQEVLRYLTSNRSPLGDSFEAFVTYNFRQGDVTYATKELCPGDGSGDGSGMLKIPKTPNVQRFSAIEELAGVAHETLCIPAVRNFPCIDLVITPNKLFQITLSENHPLKKAHLKNIARKLNHADLELYFVVPEKIYDKFKPQNYLRKDGKVSRNIPQVVRKIQQYVLKMVLLTIPQETGMKTSICI